MHDKNGNPVAVGDKVLVEAVVRETYATDEFCNVQIGIGYEEGKEHGPHNVQSIVTINTKQIEVINPEVQKVDGGYAIREVPGGYDGDPAVADPQPA